MFTSVHPNWLILNLFIFFISQIVQTLFEVVVQYDHQSYVSISVSDRFFEQLCGMCGNFNNIVSDDLTGASGNVVSYVTEC